MYNFKFFVSVGAVMAFIFTSDNEVTNLVSEFLFHPWASDLASQAVEKYLSVTAAPAPAPHPCLWMLDYDHGHPEPTTSTTAKPDVVEDFAKLKNKKTNQLEKLITDWILWGPSSEDQKPSSNNALERMISGYMKFLTKILNNMF